MLPIYLLGNIHCLGMCGPIALIMSTHPKANLYLLGRFISFTLAGFVAGGAGYVLNGAASIAYLPPIASFVFGAFLLIFGLLQFTEFKFPAFFEVGKATLAKFGERLSEKGGRSLFFVGFSTIFLPCGQTLVVYSGCALTASPVEGVVHGAFFALLTTPSLYLAMRAKNYLASLKKIYRPLMGVLAICIGTLSFCRGLADLEIIPHLVLNQKLHLVLF